MLNHDANHVFLFENTSVGNKQLIDFLVVFLLIAGVHTQANEDDFAINQEVMIRIYVINRPFSTLESLAISGVKIEHIVVNAYAVCQRSPVFIQVRTTQYECLLLGKEAYSLMNEFQKAGFMCVVSTRSKLSNKLFCWVSCVSALQATHNRMEKRPMKRAKIAVLCRFISMTV